jgi:hypothetical protein
MFLRYSAEFRVVWVLCVISGFRHEADETCAVLGYCTASSGGYLPTFRDSLSVRTYYYSLRNNPEERFSHQGTSLAPPPPKKKWASAVLY